MAAGEQKRGRNCWTHASKYVVRGISEQGVETASTWFMNGMTLYIHHVFRPMGVYHAYIQIYPPDIAGAIPLWHYSYPRK